MRRLIGYGGGLLAFEYTDVRCTGGRYFIYMLPTVGRYIVLDWRYTNIYIITCRVRERSRWSKIATEKISSQWRGGS